MEDFEFEIKNAIEQLSQGISPIAIRRNLIEQNFEKEIASKISKEAYQRFLQKNGKTKMIRGIVWFIFGFLMTVWLFSENNRLSYLVCIGTIYGFFQIISGIFQMKSSKKLSSELN